MTLVPEVYADGIGRLGFSEGMVRIELVSLVPGETEGETRPEVRHRLVMTPQGFLRALQAQHALLKKLEEAGMVTRQEAPQASAFGPN